MLCDKLSYVMDRGFDGRQLAKSDIPFPFESEIGARMTVGDICTYGPEDLNKLGKITYSAWDSFTYTMLGAHNCYSHIRAVQRINHLSDLESMRFDPDWRTWTKTKRKSKAAEPSFWVPRNLLYFNNFIKELFVSEHPMQMLEDASPLLQEMTNQKYIDGNTALFQDLFGDDSDNEIVTGEDYEREDDVLDALEKELRNED
jgi:hypothetical protein